MVSSTVLAFNAILAAKAAPMEFVRSVWPGSTLIQTILVCLAYQSTITALCAAPLPVFNACQVPTFLMPILVSPAPLIV